MAYSPRLNISPALAYVIPNLTTTAIDLIPPPDLPYAFVIRMIPVPSAVIVAYNEGATTQVNGQTRGIYLPGNRISYMALPARAVVSARMQAGAGALYYSYHRL